MFFCSHTTRKKAGKSVGADSAKRILTAHSVPAPDGVARPVPQLQGWEDTVAALARDLSGTPGVAALRRVCPGPPDIQPNHIPRLYIDLCPAAHKTTAVTQHSGAAIYGASLDHGNPLAVAPGTPPCTLAHRLAHTEGAACVAVNTSSSGVVINPQTVSAAEVPVVLRRLKQEIGGMVKDGEFDLGPPRARL